MICGSEQKKKTCVIEAHVFLHTDKKRVYNSINSFVVFL